MENQTPESPKDVEDIKKPGGQSPTPDEIFSEPAEENFFKSLKRPGRTSRRHDAGWKRIFLKSLLATILVLAGVFVLTLFVLSYTVPRDVSHSVTQGLSQFQGGLDDLKNLAPSAAQKKFTDAGNTIAGNDLVSKLGFVFRGGSDIITGFKNLTGEAGALAGEVHALEGHVWDFLFGNDGAALIAHLERIDKSLHVISAEGTNLSSALEKTGNAVSVPNDFYLPFKVDLARFQDFLDALLVWLKADDAHHIAVLFQNPSELRPAGGFLGSYADVTMRQGSIQAVDVHDINDIDRGFHANVVPPRPLQLLESRWHVADMNWFFDFPTSAEKVLASAEASDLYRGTQTFDIAVAVSPKIISDILALTGPIELPEGHVTVDADNFLNTIQEEVQQGQASRASAPKKILSELAPLLIAKMKDLDADQRNRLLEFFFEWAGNKDLMFYARNGHFENFFSQYKIAGDVYKLPQNFEGDYLAFVGANIDGGKSDLYMKENLVLESQIQNDGTVSNHLTLSRAHGGDKSKYWWYRLPNQAYLQFFVPDPAALTNTSGGLKEKIPPRKKTGYETDGFVAQIESSTEEFFDYPMVSAHKEEGKRVFTTWSVVKKGEKSEFSLDYTRRLFLVPGEGTTYQFMFEKQPGTHRTYDFSISAPVGFKFRENNLPVYEYKTEDPPGRYTVTLTLVKIE